MFIQKLSVHIHLKWFLFLSNKTQGKCHIQSVFFKKKKKLCVHVCVCVTGLKSIMLYRPDAYADENQWPFYSFDASCVAVP